MWRVLLQAQGKRTPEEKGSFPYLKVVKINENSLIMVFSLAANLITDWGSVVLSWSVCLTHSPLIWLQLTSGQALKCTLVHSTDMMTFRAVVFKLHFDGTYSKKHILHCDTQHTHNTHTHVPRTIIKFLFLFWLAFPPSYFNPTNSFYDLPVCCTMQFGNHDCRKWYLIASCVCSLEVMAATNLKGYKLLN